MSKVIVAEAEGQAGPVIKCPSAAEKSPISGDRISGNITQIVSGC